MSVKNKTNKNYKRSQKGRSMVEMLGVLAIIGVLSVGGVYGYGVAMKKHKANELLHQASMLATTISSQILTDKPLNVQDFGNGKYGTFGTPEKVNDEQFKMEITGMDSAVCEQMEKMSGGMVRKAECNETTLTLTYNNNLSSDKVAADYNDDATGGKCEAAGYKWCGGECKKDCCVGYDSQCCDSETGDISSTDSCTTADGKTTTCSNGKCEFGTKDCTGEECCNALKGYWYQSVNGSWSCAVSSNAVACGVYDCAECTAEEMRAGAYAVCDNSLEKCICLNPNKELPKYEDYCAENPSSCTEIKDSEGNRIGTQVNISGGVSFSDGVAICGGKEKMVKPEELGCAELFGSCSIAAHGWVSCINTIYSDCNYPMYMNGTGSQQGRDGWDFTLSSVLCK